MAYQYGQCAVSVFVLALGLFRATKSASAQAPAATVVLGFGVDTTDSDVGQIVRLLRTYLADPKTTAQSSTLWRNAGSADLTQRDLAARYALQGLPATIVGVLATDGGDTVYSVKLLHARGERAGGGASPIALQRLYAVRASTSPFGWQLAAALPQQTAEWRTLKAGQIVFHYAPDQRVDTIRARRAALFVDSVAALFDTHPPARINYYVTASPDAYFRALGLDFFVLPSGRGQAAGGNALPDVGVLLGGDPAQGELYRHELTHVALGNRIKLGFLNEGLAAWLGGSRGLNATQLYGRLSEFQRAHGTVTFAALVKDKLSVPQEPVASSDAWYASGALVCERVYRRAGTGGLRILADASNTDTFFHVLASLLGLADDAQSLDRWWRTAVASNAGRDQ